MDRNIKGPNQKQQNSKNTEQKFQRSKLRLEQLKRKKEGEEKAHGDGCMVG